MSVEFKDDRFVITVVTNTNPIESWLELHDEILYVLGSVDAQLHGMETPWRMLQLLSDMMPGFETALKMHPRKKG